jgi:hypothetical protein
MLSLIAALAVGFTPQAATAPTSAQQGCIADLAALVGGHWEGKLGPATVVHRYESILDGKAIHDVGTVSMNGNVVLNIDARYGWDETAKATYYLDVHNHDTVYFGHVVNAAGTFKLHFVNLCKPADEESSSFKFTDADTMEFSIMGAGKGILHRVKD